jgi:hypothetical protein
MFSQEHKKILINEIKESKDKLNTNETCVQKLKIVRSEKAEEKKNLIKQLNDVAAIVSNLDANIETRENQITMHRHSIKLKENIIGNIVTY